MQTFARHVQNTFMSRSGSDKYGLCIFQGKGIIPADIRKILSNLTVTVEIIQEKFLGIDVASFPNSMPKLCYLLAIICSMSRHR
jgi:hypothetical protein